MFPCWCKNALTCPGPQTTLSHTRQYITENGNLRKSWPIFRHGAEFAPRQCLYQKEARAMENPKMYSSGRCKKRTYLCRSPNCTVSCKAVYDRKRKFVGIRGYLSPWCSVCTKAMFIPEEAWAMKNPKMYYYSRCKTHTYLCWSANYPVSCKAV